jgi:hypothetical protein
MYRYRTEVDLGTGSGDGSAKRLYGLIMTLGDPVHRNYFLIVSTKMFPHPACELLFYSTKGRDCIQRGT